MLEFTSGTDDRALAIALDAVGRNAQRRQQAARQVQSDGVERGHQGQDVGLITTSVGVGQHRGDGATAQGHGRARSTLVVDVFDLGEDAANVDQAHGGGILKVMD